MIWGKVDKLYSTLLKSKKANTTDISGSYYIGSKKSGVNSQTASMNRYPSDEELINTRISELKNTGYKAIQIYSEVLKDNFYIVIDNLIIPELLKENIPVYTIPEILILANAPDEVRQRLHKFKRTFGARIHKNTMKGR